MRNFARLIILLFIIISSIVVANATNVISETEKYYIGEAVNTGKDNGYAESNPIDNNDIHSGWRLGRFYVSGFSRVIATENESPVFLKNVGDKVTLWFSLEQDISCLNGDKNLSISADKNGEDNYFRIGKTNFGRGTLIIRHTDYQNNATDPTVYTDYLAANLASGADVRVQLCEEGDYEVALNYEVKKVNVNLLGWKPFPTYENYQIFFKFSVRNGNCMVFPFDVETNAELTNTAVTENGFYLDFAKSRYLEIDIKKEVLHEGAEGLTEDTRFNRPAKDGEVYTEEGIYTITVRNRYTNQVTDKVIYVGKNDVLKAHAATGLSLQQIKAHLALGATISSNGEIILADSSTIEAAEMVVKTEENKDDSVNTVPPVDETTNKADWNSWICVTIAVIIVGFAVVCFFVNRNNKFKRTSDSEESME